MSKNPLLAPWTTPFEVPPFATIKTAHFVPAIDQAMVAHLAEVDAIAGLAEKPTFANTIAAMELSGETLNRVAGVFFNLSGTESTDELRAVEREVSPKFAAHQTAITANAKLFARIDQLFEGRDKLPLSAEEKRVLERMHLNFVRAGAKLSTESKKRYGEIMSRLSTLGTEFRQNLLADEKDYMLVLQSEEDRAGLPDFLIEAAIEIGNERGHPGKPVITLNRSIIEPFLTYSDRRDLREKAFAAWVKRGENGGKTDNREIITEILRLRLERAQLLGYKTFADYVLDDTMAKSAVAVGDFLKKVWGPAKSKAASERGKLAALAAGLGHNEPLAPWDWRYYAEKVRLAEFDLDEASVKPFLTLERMIEAAFHTATELFGLSFKERKDLPLYNPEVRTFEVMGANGKQVGLFYADYFARGTKRSGAWMSSFRDQRKLGGDVRPIIVNVLNFAKGAAGQPTLLSFDDAHTLFHEFGHALHGLLSNVTYPSIAGTNVPTDFVELPSQLYEHWLETPEILNRYARHYQTNEPMPKAMIDKIRAARTFNQGFLTVEYLSSALVDMEFHNLSKIENLDPLAFEKAALDRLGMPKEIVMRHRTPQFAHIFSGDGYAAGYYSYLWSEVLDADAFEAFKETGNVFDNAIAKKLRDHIYSAGGSAEPDALYTAFRGRLPSIDGLLKKRGLEAGTGGTA